MLWEDESFSIWFLMSCKEWRKPPLEITFILVFGKSVKKKFNLQLLRVFPFFTFYATAINPHPGVDYIDWGTCRVLLQFSAVGFEIWLLATDSEDAPFIHHRRMRGGCKCEAPLLLLLQELPSAGWLVGWLAAASLVVVEFVLLAVYTSLRRMDGNHLYSSNVFLSNVQRMTLMLFDTPDPTDLTTTTANATTQPGRKKMHSSILCCVLQFQIPRVHQLSKRCFN